MYPLELQDCCFDFTISGPLCFELLIAMSSKTPKTRTTSSTKLLKTTTTDSPKELIHEFSESPEKLFHQLTLHDTDVLIKARLLHSWRSVSPSNPQYIYDFGTLWADETGMLIHGIGNRNFVTEFERKLIVGSVYKIQKFIVQEAKHMYRPCRNNLSIFITPGTMFEDVTTSLDFTSDSFEFCEFEALAERIGSKALLTDVVGCLTSISEVDHKTTCNGVTPLQKLVLENERGTSLSISLWGELAYKLRAAELIEAAKTSPVIIAIGGLTVSTFRANVDASSTSATRITLNPQALEFGYFNPYPDDFGDLIKAASNALGVVSSIPVTNETPEKNAQRALESQRTVTELINMRATGESLNDIYICQATVTAVKSTKTWAYRGCTKCRRTVTNCGLNYWCEKHNQIPPSETQQWYLTRLIVQDGTDEAVFLLIGETADKLLRRKCSEVYDSFPQGTGILPPEIETLCGLTLEFHVKIPKQNYKGGEGDFTITNIIGLHQQTTKTAKRKLQALEAPKREPDSATTTEYMNLTGEMENTQHTETQVIEEISDSGRTDIVVDSRKKRKSIDLPPAQAKNGNSTSASSCKNLKKPTAVEIFTDKMPRKEHPVLGKNELLQDSRNKYDCSKQNQKGKQSKKCQKAKNNRHTDDGADTVIMVNSDDEKSSSDDDLPLSKILGDKKPPNKKSSSATKALSKEAKCSINSPLARVKKEKLEVASKSTSTTPKSTTPPAVAEAPGKRMRQPPKKYCR